MPSIRKLCRTLAGSGLWWAFITNFLGSALRLSRGLKVPAMGRSPGYFQIYRAPLDPARILAIPASRATLVMNAASNRAVRPSTSSLCRRMRKVLSRRRWYDRSEPISQILERWSLKIRNQMTVFGGPGQMSEWASDQGRGI